MPYLINNGRFTSLLGVLVRRGCAIKLTKKQAEELLPLVERGRFTSVSKKPKDIVVVEPPKAKKAKPAKKESE